MHVGRISDLPPPLVDEQHVDAIDPNKVYVSAHMHVNGTVDVAALTAALPDDWTCIRRVVWSIGTSATGDWLVDAPRDDVAAWMHKLASSYEDAVVTISWGETGQYLLDVFHEQKAGAYGLDALGKPPAEPVADDLMTRVVKESEDGEIGAETRNAILRRLADVGCPDDQALWWALYDAASGDGASALIRLHKWANYALMKVSSVQMNRTEQMRVGMLLGQATGALTGHPDATMLRALTQGIRAAQSQLDLTYKGEKVMAWLLRTLDHAADQAPFPAPPFPKL